VRADLKAGLMDSSSSVKTCSAASGTVAPRAS
jgi:hypothetical protein